MDEVTRLARDSVATASGADWGRFAPGTLLAGRFRIVAPLGRGGMGEVYRAEDLKLGQTVALKFLPEHLSHDPVRLAQFHNEVRVARTISHRNVCRTYDIDDADGRAFLTMEYVDGEDLASLLRRIGRFPQDKAVEVARQMCAGVAAAHERGVLHRDLKPANVMIDGDGHVRITDFGLASMAGSVDNVRSGTPAYMAPEQLAGREVTARSNIYALGLVLFELFTGKRAFEANSLNDLLKLHQSGAVTPPSSVVRDLDPTIERATLRCLERDPQRRPASPLAVSAALPGGNQLAAALAAGETPSPEMVAAFAAWIGFLIVGARHSVNVPIEYNRLTLLVGTALFGAAAVWLTYIALEPFVRRFWPELLIGWSRLITGTFRDPGVGREVLVGVASGAVTAVYILSHALAQRLTGSDPPPVLSSTPLDGVRAVLVTLMFNIPRALISPFQVVFVVVLLKALVKRTWLVVALAAFGFYAARGDKPLLGKAPLD